MVDDINFPKGLPPVPTAGRVERVNRKKREEEKPPFEKFFNEKDQKVKKKKKRKKGSDKVDIPGQPENRRTQNFIESASSTDAGEAEDDFAKKIIDVRV
jgi:hypothetical protein